MSTAYRPTRIAKEHHVVGKGNTTASHNTDDRQERKTLKCDGDVDPLEAKRDAEKLQAAVSIRFPNLMRLYCSKS